MVMSLTKSKTRGLQHRFHQRPNPWPRLSLASARGRAAVGVTHSAHAQAARVRINYLLYPILHPPTRGARAGRVSAITAAAPAECADVQIQSVDVLLPPARIEAASAPHLFVLFSPVARHIRSYTLEHMVIITSLTSSTILILLHSQIFFVLHLLALQP